MSPNPGTAWYQFPGIFAGMNEIIDAAKGCGGTGRMYSALKKKVTNDIALQARAQHRGPVFDRYTMRFVWTVKDRRRDPDNIIAAKKFILDGMVVGGALAGDKWSNLVAIEGESWAVGDRPGVHVTVTGVP